MSKVASSKTINLFRRAYTVVAENVKAKGQVEAAAASMMRKVDEGLKKEVFWMRDPKTGYYVPETHFNEVDAADLRAKFLSKNH